MKERSLVALCCWQRALVNPFNVKPHQPAVQISNNIKPLKYQLNVGAHPFFKNIFLILFFGGGDGGGDGSRGVLAEICPLFQFRFNTTDHGFFVSFLFSSTSVSMTITNVKNCTN